MTYSKSLLRPLGLSLTTWRFVAKWRSGARKHEERDSRDVW